ncbi:MAG TPA: FdhF/YdeP family oxidoreductase [Leptolyngbyaceae cyanobacterium]
MENRQEHHQVQESAHSAANAADNIHPSHWEPAKSDILSEQELQAQADSPLYGQYGSESAARHGDVEAHFDGVDPVRAETPEEFTGIKFSSVKDYAGGIPAVASVAQHTLGEMGLVRSTSVLLKLNQKGGIDCMSCAWADPDGDRNLIEFCENGAKAVASEATTRRVTPEFFQKWSIAELSQQSDYWLAGQGRITHPMVLRQGSTHYEPIGWDEAFALCAAELNKLTKPDEAIFYTSGRTSNEAAFLYQLFVRQFGTNNLPDCSNMCHESSGAALTETIGVGKGTVTLDDFALAEAIFIIGQNPGTNHPRMMVSLQEAKRNGCKIVSINPLREAGLIRFKHPQEISGTIGNGTKLSDLHLPVRIGGDIALLKGIMKEMLLEESRRPGQVLDRDFIDHHTAGYEEFVADLKAQSCDKIVETSGIKREQIRQAAEIMIHSQRTITCWCMGLTQNKNAVSAIEEIVNMHLMRGQIGKPGAGVCPVRGHSNVQGDRTMGIWERPRQNFLDSLGEEFNFEPPRHHGYDVVESIKAMHVGKGKVFIALGGNFLSATPDTNYTAEALRRCQLTVHVSTKINRSHLIAGDVALILPCLGRTEIDVQAGGEQFVSTENSMGVVQSSRGVLEPASPHLRSEPAIVAGLAKATLGSKSTVDWESLIADYDRIRDLIERVIPGFEDYNVRVRIGGGFYLPNMARMGKFETATGKANFTVHEIPDDQIEPGQFVMMSIRSHDQFNTTIYGLDDRYRGIHNERRVVLLNPEDMNEANLVKEQVVDLTSHFEGEERVAKHFIVVPYEIPRRCAATYYPETNVLVPIGSVAQKSNTPASKFVVISIKPSARATANKNYE